MHLLFKMAFRNIYRNAKRNFFTILSISFGLAFLFWNQSILAGHNANMIKTVTSTFTGDIQIHQKDYLEERQTQHFFEPSDTLLKVLNSQGWAWSKRIYFPSIISSGSTSYPIVLVGIVPSSEASVTRIKSDIKSGEYLADSSTCDEPKILVSRQLSEKLGVELEDKLVIMGQDANGALGNDLFRVKGQFTTASTNFDKSYAFTSLACAQSLASISGIHEVLIKTSSETAEPFVSGRLDTNLKVSTWRDLVPGVADMIKFNKAMSDLITFILFSVITLGVINAILMNIFERVREIGIMLAIGTTPNQVRLIILFESFLMAVIGVGVGTILGLVVILYYQKAGFDLSPFLGDDGRSKVGFTFETIVHPIIDWDKYLKLVLIEITFIVIAGAYPAFKASRLKPIETIRG